MSSRCPIPTVIDSIALLTKFIIIIRRPRQPAGFTAAAPRGKLDAGGEGRSAIKRTLLITALALAGGLILAVSLVLVAYLVLSLYAAGR